MPEVVVFNKGKPPLNDVAGRLRWLADEIESGREAVDAALVITPHPTGYPDIYAFGEFENVTASIVQLELAKASLLKRLLGSE